MVMVIDAIPGSQTASQYIFITLRFVAAWIAGYALRERSEQAEAAEMRATLAEHEREAAEMRAIHAEREREAAARIAVAEERARIARELHDIVAHAMSVMVLQVGAVRHKLPRALGGGQGGARARRACRPHGACRDATPPRCDAPRRTTASSSSPQPGVDGLDSLLDQVGRAGLPVQLHVDGERFPLPRAIDLSAYRIVQEGLTNALKHAHASHAEVTLGYAPEELRIEVRDDGRGSATSDGLGHGLVGVRERVKIYGGEMSAGAAPEGGFVLDARLPISEDGA